MGTTVHVVVNGPEELVERARDRIEDLESRWSRFRPESEVSRLNRHGSARVSRDTEDLVTRSISGWRHTGGRFDPTVYRSMIELGYDTSFDRIAAHAANRETTAAPGCGEIEVGGGVVRLPPGAGFDPGGIGKGLAADLVAEELITDGAEGAMVNLGGDLRAAGTSVAGAWVVQIDEPTAGVAATVAFESGAVATSTPLRRFWQQGEVRRHHLIDPARGLPFEEAAPTLASVVAAEAWFAEVCTKAAMALPPALLEGVLEDAAALVAYADGTVLWVNGMERYLR
ncbi:MAG: FAD:protein FMN transferase [Acidimicrobiia bacterium]|nr:FAD:protein FMN transferase [Acidimicrobiia bacterium]